MELKVCSKCKIERPLDQFPSRTFKRSRKDGTYPNCRICRREYYYANRERIRAQNKEFRAANAERLRAIAKAYIDKRFFYKRASNMISRGEGERTSLPAKTADISRLWKQQRGICPVTGRRLNRENAQIDHILPLTRGGTHDIENLRWVHKDVNYAKRDRIDAEFFQLCWDVVANLKRETKPRRRNGDSNGESPCLTLF